MSNVGIIYTTTDGKQFGHAGQAESHQQLLDDINAFLDAEGASTVRRGSIVKLLVAWEHRNDES